MGRIKTFIVNYLTKNLLVALSEEDILQITSEGYLLGKRKLSPEELEQLRAEANEIKDSYLWKLMKKEIEYHSFLRMAHKAQTEKDLIFGKAMFYNIDILQKFLNNLSR